MFFLQFDDIESNMWFEIIAFIIIFYDLGS